MKKFLALALSSVLALSLLAGCGSSNTPAASGSSTSGSASTGETVTLKVGASITPHAEILNQCKPILAEQGIDLEVVEYTDYVQPNTALEEGSLDANYFQHINYLNWFNGEYGTHLVSAASVHYEPFGIYAGKVSAIADLKDGDEIDIPNDGSNETRALLLLQQEGLITLKDGITAASNATVQDIESYNVNITIREIEAAQLTQALPGIAMAVINGNYALQGGLNAGSDALAIEAADGDAAQEYGNILAVKEGHENDPAILALIDVLHSDTIRDYINNTYSGAVVPTF
ncbi:MAG: MetQ/NlpA family ABC transporter substrate-binding protein [Dysosmobacter sp.]|nr:MetQ/NlpA family ABC transporter substrate-binding protein [Dysosmobacter sp.]